MALLILLEMAIFSLISSLSSKSYSAILSASTARITLRRKKAQRMVRLELMKTPIIG
jgi:hypothetical protein